MADWAALYLRHRDAMYRVAFATLRGSGREADAEDVVMTAMESLMKKPPARVANWEALLVQTTKRRALDVLRSSAVRHASTSPLPDGQRPPEGDFEDDVIDAIDRQRASAMVWDKLSILDARERRVVWECVGKQRSRAELAEELGITPSRISQLVSAALARLRSELAEEGF